MKIKALIQRHPVVSYFVMTYIISWLAALLVAAPQLAQGKPLGQLQGIIMFPAMLLGPSITGIALTAIVDGRSGLRDLFARMRRWRVGVQWYALAILIPPVVILIVLISMRTGISPIYTPGLDVYGIAFGVIAGAFEEIGWSGFVFPKMRAQRSPLAASVLLGVLWGLWHMPVVDFLGAAWPHGAYWAPFFLAFIVVMTAMRVLICWVVSNTHSVLLAQIMHASSTGCIAMFSPSPISPAHEVLWYVAYAVALWIIVALVSVTFGKMLVRRPRLAVDTSVLAAGTRGEN